MGVIILKKRIVSFMLIVIMLFCAVGPGRGVAFAETGGEWGDNAYWSLDDNNVLTIWGTGDLEVGYNYPWYKKFVNKIVIGEGITSIPAFMFSQSYVKELVLPQSLVTIGKSAFNNCELLTEVTFGKNVSTIENSAFFRCLGLERVILNDGLKSIGSTAFKTCISLTEIDIPDTVTEIGVEAFMGCTSLHTVNLSENITSIEESLFYSCSSLVNVEIPWAVNSIGKTAFYGTAIVDITVPDGVDVIEQSTFMYCRDMQSISLPDSVTEIKKQAFQACSSLKELTLPENLLIIGDYAFQGCVAIEKIDVGSCVSMIGESSFASCRALVDITFPHTLTSVGKSAFNGCDVIENIDIGKNVSSIGIAAFSNCPYLKKMHLGNRIREIPQYAMNKCYRMTEVYIPDTVTCIDTDAFENCQNITDVYYEGSELDWLNVVVNSGNTAIKNATKHYNWIFEDVEFEGDYFASAYYNGRVYDLCSQPIEIDKSSDDYVTIKINYEEGNGNELFYLIQSGNTVELKNFEPCTIIPAKVFDANEDVYFLMVSPETEKFMSLKTRLKVIENKIPDILPDEDNPYGLNIKLWKDFGFTVPDSVPVIGGYNVNWNVSWIPFSVEYDPNDKSKCKFIIGLNKPLDGKTEWEKYKEKIDRGLKQGEIFWKKGLDELMDSTNPSMGFLDLPVKKNTSFTNYAFVLGYIEGKVINEKFRFTESALYGGFSSTARHTGNIFVSGLPLYYEIGVSPKVTTELKFTDLQLQPYYLPKFEGNVYGEFKLNIGAGVGFPTFVSAGLGGEAKLNAQLKIPASAESPYQKISLSGNSNMNVKVFSQVVLKKVIAGFDKVIYETGNPDALVPDSAVSSASLASVEKSLNQIDINKSYEPEDRSYLNSKTSWHGDDSKISLMSIGDGTKDKQLLSNNVYTDSAPMICNIDGKKVMVMLWDNVEREASNKTMLVYSVYDNETSAWSEPIAVCDDGTADFYPDFRDGVLVWHNSKSALSDGMTLAEIAKEAEISVAKWNGTGFDSPVSLTDNAILDTQPTVATNGKNIAVTWINNSTNDITGMSGNNTILQRVYDGNEWTEATLVKESINSVIALSSGYDGENLSVAYICDGDNDFTTIDDRDIKVITKNGETVITDNETVNSNPVFDGDRIYYYTDGNIAYSETDGANSGTVFEEAMPGVNENFSVSTNSNGETVIFWPEVTETGSGIYGVIYRDGEWSEKICMTESENKIRYVCGVVEPDDSVYLAYNEAVYDDGNITESDLYTLSVIPSYDLAIGDVYLDEENQKIYVTVKNDGELAVESYKITLNGAEDTVIEEVNEVLKAGALKEVVLNYVTPDVNGLSEFIIEVSSDSVTDIDTLNDIYTLSAGRCDVEVSDIMNYEKLPVSQVKAKICNKGYSDTGKVKVYLRKDSADGEILAEKILYNIPAGASMNVDFEYDVAGVDNIQWYITAECENEEISLGNNDMYFINNYANTVENYEDEIIRCVSADNKLNVCVYTENNTASGITAKMFAAVYDDDGNLKAIDIKDAPIDAYGNKTINFSVDKYNYESGDKVKILMWNGEKMTAPYTEAVETLVVAE